MEVMVAPAARKSRRRVLTVLFYGSRNRFSKPSNEKGHTNFVRTCRPHQVGHVRISSFQSLSGTRAVLLVSSELPRQRLPFGVAQLASLLPPSLPTGPTSDRAGIDLPLCYLEPPALRLSGPHLVATTILAFKMFVSVPGLGRIGIVRSMLRHIGPDCIVRDYRHQIFPKLFHTKAGIPNGSRTRPRSAFFPRFFVNRIGHVCPSV